MSYINGRKISTMMSQQVPDNELSLTSYNSVQNRVVTAALNQKLDQASINNKVDKVSNATSGNFAVLDVSGNIADSESKASDFATINTIMLPRFVFYLQQLNSSTNFYTGATIYTAPENGYGVIRFQSSTTGYINIITRTADNIEICSRTFNLTANQTISLMLPACKGYNFYCLEVSGVTLVWGDFRFIAQEV